MSYILVIEDEKMLADSIAKFLNRDNHRVTVSASGEDGLNIVRDNPPDIVILDYRLPGKDGLEVLKELKEIEPNLPVIMMTAYGTVETAVKAMKSGAYDYIEKPVDLIKLQFMINKLLEREQLRQEIKYHRELSKIEERDGFIGKSPAVRKILERVQTLVKYDSAEDGAPTTLICGETGTGKGVLARTIHRLSSRADKPFIQINCTAIPENMIEAELFGYRRGAFTDAKTGKAGLMEAADGGTLFLDEIGHLGLDIQTKLLKVVEEKVVRRLSELQDRKINVRIIAATNRNLEVAKAQGLFREDLYHRLNVIRFDIPPLRERKEDIELLARFFLKKYSKNFGKNISGFTYDAIEAMMKYPWPGNVRELSNIIERAVILENAKELSAEHLGLTASATQLTEIGKIRNGIPEKTELEGTREFVLPPEGIILEELEKKLIEQALHRTKWNRSKAARLLGISLDTLRYRIEKYGMNQ